MNAARPIPLRPDTPDEELMRQLAAGHQEALGPLYARYAPLIYGIGVRSLDGPAAEEVVQDVLLSVWRAAGSYDPQRGAVRSWVLQIAHYRILNELRRRSRRPQAEPDPEGLRLLELPDREPDPAEMAERAESRAAVRAALEELPPTQRQVLNLAFFSGLTHEQVARQLDLPLGTTKSRIRSGMQKLRVALAPSLAAAILALGGLLTLFGVRYHVEQERSARQQRGLLLATTSETTELHLAAAPGAPAAVHGAYRGRPGVSTAVVSIAHAQPAPRGEAYRAWVRHGSTWRQLGVLRPDASGSALLISDGQDLTQLPDEVRVTLEPAGQHAAAPGGNTVIGWTGP
ncbi:MAG TPA: sigma-70 family RNA polymerase sigma factor [Dehalococcoidia bacterium]|nr:sigma-70 family RNA polymerase sigma factor [Dehalococcoidia bacterium]